MHFHDICQRLGLPKHADTVYTILSQCQEPLLVAPLAKRARISRMATYRCLAALVRIRAVEKVSIGKRASYTAGNPESFSRALGLLEERSKKALESRMTAYEKDVPRSVRFLHGPAGIRAAFDDVVLHTQKGDTFYRYTSERNLAQVNQYLSRDYRSRRDAKRLERLVISNTISGKQKRSRLERFIKYVPPEIDRFEQDIIQLVYGDRVAFIDLTSEQVMIIENKKLADFQKVIFKLLYKRL